jgi:hypothetical protein
LVFRIVDFGFRIENQSRAEDRLSAFNPKSEIDNPKSKKG